MINKKYYYGLLLMIIGVLLLLFNLNILTFDIVLLILSIGLIIIYSSSNRAIYLIAGLALFIASSLSLIDDYVFVNISIRPFIYLSSGGIASLVLYYKNKNNTLLLILGLGLIFLGIHHLLGEIMGMELEWLRFIALSLAFYLSYLVGYRDNGIVWPKYVSIVILVLGGIRVLSSILIGNFSLWKFILLSISIIIAAFGAKIIYDTMKQKI